MSGVQICLTFMTLKLVSTAQIEPPLGSASLWTEVERCKAERDADLWPRYMNA